jgi:hypothetical protein
MAAGRLNPMPSENTSQGTAIYRKHNPVNASREGKGAPTGGTGSDPRAQTLVGPDFTMQQLSRKKVD